jgi:crotonobetainyl-CoA:carnitine CoA-transferase CaiB-like acyl-CoA transferase
MRFETKQSALDGITVVEIGSRCGASAAGSLLAQLGATVVFVELPAPDTSSSKHRHRAQFAAGKHSLVADPVKDKDLLAGLMKSAHAIISSSDVDGDWTPASLAQTAVVCDVTAYGRGSASVGRADTDLQIQALTGIVETTGIGDAAPLPIPFPIVELMTGVYAAAAIVAALRVQAETGAGQFIDMALYDCAFAAMATFLPRVLTGNATPIRRMGNRHPMIAPWNVYHARDGWVLICIGNDAQWRRFCETIGRPQFVDDPRFVKMAKRLANVDAVDGIVQSWVGRHAVHDVIRTLNAIEIACGPVSPIDGYPRESNLDHRAMIRTMVDPASGRNIALPESPLRMSATPGHVPEMLPAPDSGRSLAVLLASKGRVPVPAGKTRATALQGLRVVEIGHYTTVPLSTRMLASLGAEVIKIEPPDGEATRDWPPAQNGQGYFFTYMNSDKRSLMLDLRKDEDAAKLRELLKTADVLIENLKPGALARRGFSIPMLAELNPRLISCSVSGFGVHSLYAGRPAYDTVIQAMSGVMDVIRVGDVPVKTGISSADLLGAEFAVLAVLAALMHRDRSGCGQAIDLSMQDISAWMTQTLWNDASRRQDNVRIIACSDGHLLVEAEAGRAVADLLGVTGNRSPLSREALAASLAPLALRVAPVLTVHEMAFSPQTMSRGLWFTAAGEDGLTWPLLASPLRLTTTPPAVRNPMPRLGRDNDAILGTLSFSEGAVT